MIIPKGIGLFVVTCLMTVPTCSLATEEGENHSNNLRRNLFIDENALKRVFIQYKPGKHDETRMRIMRMGRSLDNPIKFIYDFEDLEAFVISCHESTLNLLRQDINIEFAEEDQLRYPMYMPDSIKYGRHLREILESTSSEEQIPYGIRMVQAPQAWNYGVKGNGIKVCVIDSGLDKEHEDLDQSKLTGLEGSNILDWTQDGIGHGTHVTGTIAARADNDIGVVGVAPEAEIYTVRVFSDSGGFAYASGIVNAARQCREVGAQIISMSLGGPIWNPFEFRAFTNLMDDGVITIAAAGNSGNNGRSYPASYEGVMSVAAIDERKEVAFFSQRNARVDISAPGVDVLSLLPMDGNCLICDSIEARNGYGAISGTSMATPHVSGVAALLLSRFPNASPQEVIDAIQDSAEDLGRAGRDNSYGHGLVQALDALELLNGGPLGDDPPPIDPPEDQPLCGTDEVSFQLKLVTDDYAYETWWDLVRGTDGGTHLSGAGYENNSEYTIERCVPNDCYTFSIYDSAGDGICCGYGEGSFSLFFDGEEVLSSTSASTRNMAVAVGECTGLFPPPKTSKADYKPQI